MTDWQFITLLIAGGCWYGTWFAIQRERNIRITTFIARWEVVEGEKWHHAERIVDALRGGLR